MSIRRGSDLNYARAHPSTAEEMEIRRVLRDMDLAVFGNYETPIGGPPSEEELADMEGYCAVATPGPWHWTTDALNGEPYKGRRQRSNILVYQLQGSPRRDRFENEVLTLNWGQLRGSVIGLPASDDQTFIALARTDMPRLIAEVRRLRGALDARSDEGERA